MSGPTRGRYWIGMILLAALICGVGCDGDDAIAPRPGTLEVRLVSPYADDAALVARVTGPDIGGLVAVDPNVYLHAVEVGGGVAVVVVGDLAPGPLVRFSVPDVGDVADYSATVLQAADRSNALRESVEGFDLTVVQAGGS